MKRAITIACFLLSLTFIATAQTKKAVVKKAVAQPASRLVEITTNYGNITVKLYDSTPLHRDNFIRLVEEGFYDSLLFHRVINEFMIQGGDPTSKNAPDTAMLGSGEVQGQERIPAEFSANYFHKKGALAAARDNNPEKASSNCQFYIVEGKTFSDTDINMIECQVRSSDPAFSFTAAQREIYQTIGGTPFLDQNYTVFGEVVKGLDVVDKIANLPRNANDRPLQNVIMKMRLLN